MTRIFKLFIPIIVITAVAGYLLYSYAMRRETPSSFRNAILEFSHDIASCNSAVTQLRFSCYRSIIERHYGNDAPAFVKIFQNTQPAFSDEEAFANTSPDISYAIFGTNCHTFYHAAGDFIATKAHDQNLPIMVTLIPKTCTAGYVMGLYKRLSLMNHFSSDLLMEFYKVCPGGAEHQCAHEIGHLLNDKYTYSILKTLDALSAQKYGLVYPIAYEYVTFPNGNLDAPFEECKKIVPEGELAYCFTGIGHNLFLFSEFSPDGYKSVIEECAGVKIENRESCYAFLVYRIGINEAATRFLSKHFEEGRNICNEMVALTGRKDMKEHCYLGIGGGIGLYVDSEYPSSKITDQNLVEVKQQLLDFLRLCEKSEESFIDQCLAGIFGTRLGKLYDQLHLQDERIEKLRPFLDTGFEVVG